VIKQQLSVTINRPIQDVFSFAGAGLFANNSKWSPDLQQCTPTSGGPLGVGATAHQVRLVNGKPTESDMRITEFVPNGKVSFTSQGPMNTSGTYTFAPAGGGTQVNLMLEMKPEGFGRLAEPIISRKVKQSMEEDLARLKQILETGRAS
jgi:Polyketide cyclase / dehydrase and lipid transport